MYSLSKLFACLVQIAFGCIVFTNAYAQSKPFTLAGEFTSGSRILSGSKVDCKTLGVEKLIVSKVAVFSRVKDLKLKCSTIEFLPNAILTTDGSISLVTEKLIGGSGATLTSIAGQDGPSAPQQNRTVPQAQNGNPGQTGPNGSSASSGVRWQVKNVGLGIKTKVPVPYSHGASAGQPGGQGGSGTVGRAGFPGIEGGDGLDGGRVSITANQVEGRLRIMSPGGAGGEGGKGGIGGAGGDGGRGGAGGKGGNGILNHPAKNGGAGGSGGDGGRGGIGGVGGAGGDGGNGGDVSLQVVNSEALNHFVIVNAGGRAGNGGDGGNGGPGGGRGPGGPGGCGGASGDPFRGDGACGGHGGNGQIGGAGSPGARGSQGQPGKNGEVGVLDKKTVPLVDFRSIFEGA